MWIPALIISLVAYLLGSFPSGYIVSRAKGIDIRTMGSGNIGATNVLRALGKRAGYLVFFLDAFKGFSAVRIALFVAQCFPPSRESGTAFGVLAAVVCVLGHSFPVWLGFKGGKGVATSAGAIVGLMPLAALIIFIVWVIVFETTRYVSVASIVASIALPVTVAILLRFGLTNSSLLVYFSVALAAVVVWRHRSNFARLLNGTEQRFTRK